LKKVEKEMGHNTTTDNLEIDAYCFKNIKNYVGTYPFDLAPILKNGQSCIINLDSSEGPGEHWMSLIKNKSKLYGYDSFGRKINKLIKLKFRPIINDTKDKEQDLIKTETNCGQRSISWLICFKKYGLQSLLI
jgi:hypothetical protein